MSLGYEVSEVRRVAVPPRSVYRYMVTAVNMRDDCARWAMAARRCK
jgi:hypothetical protein